MEKRVEIPLMEEKQFEDYLKDNSINLVEEFYNNNTIYLRAFDAVRKYKSIRRAIRRGHVSIEGYLYPNRPFNNRKNSSKRRGKHSRVMNERKKMIYEQLKDRKLN